MKIPLLVVAGAFAAGSAVGACVGVRSGLTLLALAALLLGLGLAAPLRGARMAVGAAALALGAAGAGAEARAYEAAPLLGWFTAHGSARPVHVVGICRADPRDKGDRWELVVDVDAVEEAGRSERAPGRVRVEVSGRAARPNLVRGDRVSLWAVLRRPRGFGTPGAFDAEAHARRAGVHLLGSCKSPRLVEALGRSEGAGPIAWATHARRRARARLMASVPPGPEQALVRAMVVGDRTGLDPDTAEAFRVAGTYHVLALSGAQVALLAALAAAALRACRAGPGLTAVVVAAALAFYAVFVGGDVPVVRATVMAIAVLAGRVIDLDGAVANLLGLAALVLLASQPSSIGDPGFQLSFAATLGLVGLSRPVVERLTVLPSWARGPLAASLAAQAALLPLLAWHFHRLAPAALVLNLAAVPLSSAVLLSGFAVLAAGAVTPAAADAAGLVAWAFARLLLLSGEVVRGAPALDVRVPAPALGVALAGMAGLVGLATRRRHALAVWAVATAALVGGWAPQTVDGRFHVAFLDVGQGDAIVLRSPGGRTSVVDAGAAFEGGLDLGEAVVAPYLWHAGTGRIDHMVLTHPHPDHVGGAPFVARTFDVREVWEGLLPRADRGARASAEALQAAGVARRAVRAGVVEDWDGVRLDVLGPPGGPPPLRTRNDDSVVLRATFGEVAVLLTGDLESAGEGRLRPGPALALKVAHHGSRSSSGPAFLARVAPTVAVVSAGERNPFGHPHPEVLDRCARAGVRVFRTDRDGTVTFSTDGVRAWVRTHREDVPVRVR